MATRKKSTLSGLAKKAMGKTPEETKPVELEESKETKTQQKIEELLKDLPQGPGDDLLILDEGPEVDKESTEWLQEQVSILTTQNEELAIQAEEATENYKKLYNQLSGGAPIGDSGDVKKGVIAFFTELQANYLRMGKDQKGESKLFIAPTGFMNKLLQYFPFLQEYKRF